MPGRNFFHLLGQFLRCENRRGVEALGSEMVGQLSYYERWIVAFANILFQKSGLETYWGHETSDRKVAQIILQLATEKELPAHLLLGSDAVQYARLAEDKRESEAKVWLEVSVSTDAAAYRGGPF